MAKKSTAARAIVVRPYQFQRPQLAVARPAPITIRMPATPKAPKKHHRRHGMAGHAYESRHQIGAIAGGFVLGMIDKSNIAVPVIPMLGKAGTLGVAAWALGKWGKSEWARHAATGFLSIAAYELSKEGKISGDDGVNGDLDGMAAGL